MITVRIDRRALCGVRCVDAITGQRLSIPVRIDAPGTRWTQNRSGDFALLDAPGLAAHSHAFDAVPAQPLLGGTPLDLTVHDPTGVFLSRRLRLPLPLDPDPAHASQSDSLYLPIPCRLYRAPHAALPPNWAVVRGTVAGRNAGSVLAGALVLAVSTADGRILGRGLSDARGEVVVAAAGIPVTTWSELQAPAVLVQEVAARLDVIHDAVAGAVVDPEDLEERRATLVVRSHAVQLASGRRESRAL